MKIFLPTFLMFLACTGFPREARGQTPVTYTTTGVLYVQSGADKLGLNGSTFSVSNVLTEGQAPVTGTTNQFSTTVTFSDPSAGFTKSAPATVTINYVGPNSASNTIGLVASISELTLVIDATSTISVPSISGVSPGPISSTPLSNNYLVDSLTLSNSSGSTTYGFTSGTISSVPAGNGCSFNVTPVSLSFPTGGGSSAVSIVASAPSCAWTASASQSFIQLSATSGTGSGTVTVTTANNSAGATQSGVATIAGQPVTVTQTGTVQCSFSVTPSTLSFSAAGGQADLTITANAPSCTWTASANQSWIQLAATSGSGSGSLPVTVLSNATSGALSGAITVAGQTVSVTETASNPCTYSVSPTTISYDITGGSTTLNVTASSPTCTWTAVSNQTWATLSTASGSGSGTVQVTATANANSASEGAILTVAGQSIPLNEEGTAGGCTFTVAPNALNFPGLVTTVTSYIAASAPSCPWNISLYPSWISLPTTLGTGSGPIVITALTNTGAARTGNMTIAGNTIALTQLSEQGCTFTVNPTSVNFSAEGGSDTVNVTAIAPECSWTSSSNQTWTSLTPPSGTGNGAVTITAQPNPTTSLKFGSVTIGGQPITVSQGGLTGCYFELSPAALSFPGTGGTSLVNVTASYPTCGWTATPSASWITFLNGSGTGSGSFEVVALPNTTAASVSGTVTVGAATVSITESAGSSCAFTLSSTGLLFPASGGNGLITVTANAPTCAWMASSTAPFIALSTTGLTGSGSLTATAAANSTGSPQSGIITVAGQPVTVSESGACSFSISPSSVAVDSNGGAVTLNLLATNSPCPWNAVSGATWATVNPANGSANSSTSVSIVPNTTGLERTTTIALAGQSIPVFQALTAQLFADVPPSAFYFDAVNLMAAKSITAGCATDEFCPDDDLTRAEMAIFLIRSIYGGNTFPYPATPIFSDVPTGSFGFAYIQALATLGITTGCGDGLFCPNGIVTRDQLAVFLVRARLGATAVFSYPPTPIFTDVPSTYWAFSWIQRLASDDITAGCAPSLYCPTDPVTRGEIAVLLMRALFNDLLPLTTPILTGITPAVISQGQIQTFVINGVNTNFAQGTTLLSPIPGITIGAITVNSPTTLTVNLSAASSAPVEPESVLVITGAQQAVLPNGLSVQNTPAP